MTAKRNLPPLVARYAATGVEWKGLKGIDFAFVGYMLTCHLVIEHYMDHFLSNYSSPPLAWEDARLQFSQKVNLIAKLPCFSPPWDFIPSIKHLNSLRNRFAHDVTKTITTEDLKPFHDALRRMAPKTAKAPMVPKRPHKVLELYTLLVCAWFGGSISQSAISRATKKKSNASKA